MANKAHPIGHSLSSPSPEVPELFTYASSTVGPSV